MGTVGPPEGSGGGSLGGQNRFSKNPVFKSFAAKFFVTSQGLSPGVKKDNNLTFNAFCIENFHLDTLWFPGGS